MAQIIQDLRIGSKLAITSVLGMLLVGALIFAQMSGNSAVRQRTEASIQQSTLARLAVEAKASVRGMMVGVRDLRLATSPGDLQAAQDYLDNRFKAAQTYVGEALKLSKAPENRARIEKMNTLVGDYYNRAAREIAAVQKETVAIEGKRGTSGELAPELEVQLFKHRGEVYRIAREIGQIGRAHV